jgi:hypothetical protein
LSSDLLHMIAHDLLVALDPAYAAPDDDHVHGAKLSAHAGAGNVDRWK